jgi:hypothetical protein
MTLEKTKDRFSIISKIFLLIMIVFGFSDFTTKIDRATSFRIQLNDSLLCNIIPGKSGEAHITIPHWKEGDTLKINYIAGCGGNMPIQYSFRLQNNTVLADYYTKEQELSTESFVKITPDNLPKKYYRVYYRYPFPSFEPSYLFDITFKED